MKYHAIKLNPRTALIFCLAAFAVKLALCGYRPFRDSTEGRYAVVARQMYESGNYVTPEIIDRPTGKYIPYWAKPPLHIWLIAASYHIFGISEFSSRLPSLLSAVIVMLCTVYLALRLWGSKTASGSAMILASCLLFFFGSEGCFVDMTLAAAVSVTMLGFALSAYSKDQRSKTRWGYVFFAGLALGMLVKGPIAVVLPATALVLWSLWIRKASPLWDLPWISGFALFLFISAPWYLLAERATPGFLHYFFVTEHIERFISGNPHIKYGAHHPYFHGFIWIFFLALFTPWTLFLLFNCKSVFARGRNLLNKDSGPWFAYALCWSAAPALFFTLSSNILGTYVLPGIGGFSLAASRLITGGDTNEDNNTLKLLFLKYTLFAAVLCSSGLVVYYILYGSSPRITALLIILTAMLFYCLTDLKKKTININESFVPLLAFVFFLFLTSAELALKPRLRYDHSTAGIVEAVEAKVTGRYRLNFAKKPSFSVYFYSSGEVIQGVAAGLNSSEKGITDLFVYSKKEWNKESPAIKHKLKQVGEAGKYLLFVKSGFKEDGQGL